MPIDISVMTTLAYHIGEAELLEIAKAYVIYVEKKIKSKVLLVDSPIIPLPDSPCTSPSDHHTSRLLESLLAFDSSF